jgi:hypothetical protein
MFKSAEEGKPQQGDVTIYSLLVEVLKSIYQNEFFDFSQSLKSTVPILMNLALVSTFHSPSLYQVLHVK